MPSAPGSDHRGPGERWGPVAAGPAAADESLDVLLARTLRVLRHNWSRQDGAPDLAPHQGRALRIVDEDGPLRLSELADRLRIAPRSATEVADALQERGLVERSPDPSDRRATLLAVTPHGHTVAAQVARTRREQAQAFFGRLSEPDRQALRRILGELLRP
ncbi:MAG: MarR family transcriptional regulator [Tetrasphaera sp.]